MTDILAQMEAYQAALIAAEVRCALDARDVNPPAVLIRPPTMNYRFGRGCVSAEWAAWLFLPDSGQLNSLRTGLPILETVHDALSGAGVALLSASPADFSTADGATVPGFIINWNSSR